MSFDVLVQSWNTAENKIQEQLYCTCPTERAARRIANEFSTEAYTYIIKENANELS